MASTFGRPQPLGSPKKFIYTFFKILHGKLSKHILKYMEMCIINICGLFVSLYALPLIIIESELMNAIFFLF